MPTLSICIPTYNRLTYLRELMDGLLPQVRTMPAGSVEVCVSNNAATDGTEDYLRSLDCPALRWWTNRENVGGDRNFLKCIEEAKGDYVWLVGDDELVPERAVEQTLAALRDHAPDLLISVDADRPETEYANYGEFLCRHSAKVGRTALAHTLISANVFRRELFDMPFAVRRLYTCYAHMFGLVSRLNGKVVTRRGLVAVRPVRAAFAKYPSCLCIRQALYLTYLAKRFSQPRLRFFAILLACNLPIEYASRLKNALQKRFGGS